MKLYVMWSQKKQLVYFWERPWQYDRKVTHEGVTNKFSFVHVVYVVGSQGVKINVKKIKAIQSWPTPKSVSHMRRFHGLANFYKHFVKDLRTPSFLVTFEEPYGISLVLSFSSQLLVILKQKDRLNQVLECFNYDDYVKVRMVTYEFSGYGLVWWNQYIREIRDGRRRHIDTWLDLKREMRTRSMPTSYARDLYNKLYRMYQGSKNVEEYFKEMEVSFMRANMLESNEATMA
ncbi:hypothetical protein CR513_37356, partial [Mucuna pruriens]